MLPKYLTGKAVQLQMLLADGTLLCQSRQFKCNSLSWLLHRFKPKPVWKDRWVALIPRCDLHGDAVETELLIFSRDKLRLKATLTTTGAQSSQQSIPLTEGAAPKSTVALVRPHAPSFHSECPAHAQRQI